MSSSLDSHREDTLWSKFNEIKAVLRESRRAGKAPVKFSTGIGAGNAGQTVMNTYSAAEPPRYDDSGRFVDMTLVYDGIFIGGEGAAKNTFYLKKLGVTHVLNTAEGSRAGCVDTQAAFYKPFGIAYKGLKLLDVAQTNIAMYFNEVAEFIDEAVKGGGKVLVNCMMGMSRSSTCVLAYLMLKQNMSAVQALTEVRKSRDVRPNDGFLRQLADLDNKLRRERGTLMK